MSAADAAALRAERTDVINLLRIWTGRFVAAGAPEDFRISLDGESYDFSTWRAEKLAEIKTLTELIGAVSAPWVYRSRQRGG